MISVMSGDCSKCVPPPRRRAVRGGHQGAVRDRDRAGDVQVLAVHRRRGAQDLCIAAGDLDPTLGAECSTQLLFNWANGISSTYLARIGPTTTGTCRSRCRIELAALLMMMHPTRATYSPSPPADSFSRSSGQATPGGIHRCGVGCGMMVGVRTPTVRRMMIDGSR